MNINAIKNIKDFTSLAYFLAEELNWPIDPENTNVEDITFDYEPDEIGLSDEYAAKVKTIKQLQPLNSNQPWSIFWIDFESKKLPLTVLRRILSAFVQKKQGNNRNLATKALEDLMFVSGHGEEKNRAITFAHFKRLDDVETIREFYWDGHETKFDDISNYLEKLEWPTNTNDAVAWRDKWKGAFTGSTREAISTSGQLAKVMANIAKNIRDRVLEVLIVERKNGPVHKLYDTFRTGLVHDMTERGFADMYAQTITYGLFSARTMDTDGHFELHEVIDLIPTTNPFLKDLFKECLSTGDKNHKIDLDELGVGRLVDLFDNLNRTDGTDSMQRILAEFGRQTFSGQEDPVIHFYEGFLKEYDGLQRIDKGVYYTPDPIVKFIVKSVNEKLKAVFGLEYGLADTTTWAEMVSSGRAEYPVDPNTGKTNKEWIDNIKGRAFVQILDPATGTGTFIKHTIDIIYNEVKSKHNKDKIKIPWIEYWNDYVYKNLLTRIYGFELMMASYSVAHMKLGMHLKSTGYKFEKNQRLNVYLTNSLEPYSSNSNANLFFTSVGAESIGANEVKKNRFFSVIIGNPPYNAMSKNQNDWIMTLMEDYKKEPGPGNKKLKERNPKMINDDYVKFIRLSQYLLERNKSGIIAFINPHGFINSDTFRGVRWSLVNNFNSIYICDLHGNTKKNISSSKGIKDENVFDITQGVGINIFVRNSKLTSKNLGDVKYKSLVGNREFKYSYLSSNELTNIDFENIHLNEPKYNFINFKMKGDDYFSFIAINDLFRFNSTGLQTDKDDFCIKFQKEELMNQWKDIQDHNADELRIKYELGEDTSSWSLKNAISDIKKSKIHIDKISLIQYRPFDIRYSYYTGNSNGFMGRPRRELVQHLTEISNCSLITIKNSRSSSGWNFIFASKFIPTKPTSITSLDANYVFPLYLNSDKTTKLDFENNHLNLNPEYISKIAKKLGIKFSDGQSIDDNSFSPFDIFDFVYGVLHSPSYREKYDELLKTDFPRIPYPKNQDIFWRLVKTGRELRQIHLLESASVDNIIISFPVLGNNEVLKSPEYNNNKVYINNEQYFDGVPEIAWNSYIGGYQPAQKWLKDRKGLSITAEEINHYKKIIIALIETTRIMNEIDKIDFMEGELNADYPTQVDDFQVAADSGA